jgi:hypothetical protein
MSRSAAGYLSGQRFATDWTLLAGYRELPGTFFLGGEVRRALSDTMSLFVGGSYEEDRGNWAAAVGLEFAFGPSSGRCGRCCYTSAATSQAPIALASHSTPRGVPIRNINVPGDVTEQPPANAGEFPLGLGAAEPAVAMFDEPWTSRYYNWNPRQALTPRPEDAWRGMNLNGLVGPQNDIQAPFSKFSPRTNGGFGRTDGRTLD